MESLQLLLEPFTPYLPIIWPMIIVLLLLFLAAMGRGLINLFAEPVVKEPDKRSTDDLRATAETIRVGSFIISLAFPTIRMLMDAVTYSGDDWSALVIVFSLFTVYPLISVVGLCMYPVLVTAGYILFDIPDYIRKLKAEGSSLLPDREYFKNLFLTMLFLLNFGPILFDAWAKTGFFTVLDKPDLLFGMILSALPAAFYLLAPLILAGILYGLSATSKDRPGIPTSPVVEQREKELAEISGKISLAAAAITFGLPLLVILASFLRNIGFNELHTFGEELLSFHYAYLVYSALTYSIVRNSIRKYFRIPNRIKPVLFGGKIKEPGKYFFLLILLIILVIGVYTRGVLTP